MKSRSLIVMLLWHYRSYFEVLSKYQMIAPSISLALQMFLPLADTFRLCHDLISICTLPKPNIQHLAPIPQLYTNTHC